MAKPVLESRYGDLLSARSSYLNRAKAYAKMSISYLYKEQEAEQGSESVQHGWTSFGSKAANHLANKIVQTMFPIEHVFFQPEPTLDELKKMEADGVQLTDVSQFLSEAARKAMKYMGEIMDRQSMSETAKHLIVGGNVALYYPNSGNVVVIGLKDYVCQRDAQGTVLEFIWKQTKALGTMSKVNQDLVKSKKPRLKPEDKVDLYTGIKLLGNGKYRMLQECEGAQLTKSDLNQDAVPFDVLRWTKISGEHYGHSHLEDHAGDLYSHYFLSECQSKGIALMTDVKFLVKNGGTTNIRHLITAPQGEFVAGNIEDIGVLQLGKLVDYTTVNAAIMALERNLGAAFLLNSAVRRDAERVTTYELRMDAVELESTLGGMYSLLAKDWQSPLAARLMKRVDSRFNGKTVSYKIVTGVDTLGRANELDKIMQFGQMMQIPAAWPEGVQARVKWGEYTKVVTSALSMSVPWLMTDDEFAKAQKQMQDAQKQAMMDKGMADAIPTVAQPLAQAAAGQ